MSRVYVNKAEEEHIPIITTKLRAADILEVYKMNGCAPDVILKIGVKTSKRCRTMFVDGTPEAMYGVSIDNGVHRPWFISSYEPMKHKAAFMEISITAVEDFKTHFSYLENFVDVENEVAIRWLGKIGFKVIMVPVPMGVHNGFFYKFFWRKK